MFIELDKICQNCCYYFSDCSNLTDDLRNGFGVCLRNDDFNSYIEENEEIVENSDFSYCIELYQEKRFDGDREACSYFEPLEIIDTEYEDNEDNEDNEDYADNEDYETVQLDDAQLDRMLEEYLQSKDYEKLLEMLYSSDEEEKTNALAVLFKCTYLGGKEAYSSLLKYYKTLPPVISINDTHFRMKILEVLISMQHINEEYKIDLIDMLINELYKTPSNNTTRQLYTQILKFLDDCPEDIVADKLLWLLGKKKYSSKMEQNILSVIYK